jgi:mannose-6-phosphate isomerase
MSTKIHDINQIPLYPLRFRPIFQYRIWGGRRLDEALNQSLPIEGPVGEAWVLSDREDHPSIVANGPHKGQTISELLHRFPEQIMGKIAGRFSRFPLLLKFLDAKEMLSVQVHPSDRQKNYLPEGEHGKTEAWFVLEAEPESRIYAGLKQGTNEENLEQSIKKGTVADCLSYFTPKPGDGVFIPAGTVHTLGGNIVVFEVQQNSDVTFRLYDWDHVDAKTNKKRDLQIEQALACIDFSKTSVGPVVPVVESANPVLIERFFDCEHFVLRRLSGDSSFKVGAEGKPRVVVCIAGNGKLESGGANYDIGKGDVYLMPAVIGECLFNPKGAVTLLEISLPEGIITQ